MPKVRMPDGSVVDVTLDQILADDGQNPFVAPAPVPSEPVFTAADVERVRKEEKDKLYGRLEELATTVQTLESKLTPLTQAEEQRLAQAQAEQAQREEEARRLAEADLDPRDLVERARQEWEAKLNDVTSTLQASEAAREKERQYVELQQYIQDQIAAHTQGENADVAPEFAGFISGNSKEEVDAAIERAKQSTQSILEQFQSLNQQPEQIDPSTGQPFAQQVPVVDPQAFVVEQPQVVPSAPPTFAGSRAWGGPSNVDPAGEQTQTLTADDIRRMDMNEYAKYRSRLGVAPQGHNHGMFG